MKQFVLDQQQQQRCDDDEEAVALVPPPQSSPDRGGILAAADDEPAPTTTAVKVKQKLYDDDHHLELEAAAAADTTSSSHLKAAAVWWSCWRRNNKKLQVPTTRSVAVVIGGLVVLALLVGSTSSSWWTKIHLGFYESSSLLVPGGEQQQQRRWRPHHAPSAAAELVAIPFSCDKTKADDSNSSASSGPWKCRRCSEQQLLSPSPATVQSSAATPPVCPDYFRYIHSDLSPWRESGGISREAVERGRPHAAFRVVVVDGRAYVETYHRVFQTRDTFTQWGIAQLLARYPGRVPDLDLMFNCEDMPEIPIPSSGAAAAAPPLFRYCKDASTLDIVFPDWSFWGWPEVNIRPWAPLLEEMAAETARLPWADRQPYAYWKGNPGVSDDRRDLLRRCNSTDDWGARVFAQDWGAAARHGFRGSNLARQCTYRYKVYVRGRSWSVSEKYILACDSPVLLLDTPFADFFSRGLVAGTHYWPIDPGHRKCAAIKAAVHWGNAHPDQARRMADQGSGFARHDLSMDYVYDYMLHLLTQYARLLRYKPTVPDNAVELCPETVACPAHHHSRDDDRAFQFMMESREKYVADYQPCTLPPPFTHHELTEMERRDKQVRANVQKMTIHMMKKHHA